VTLSVNDSYVVNQSFFNSYIDQALLTTSSPSFADMTLTGDLTVSGTGTSSFAGDVSLDNGKFLKGKRGSDSALTPLIGFESGTNNIVIGESSSLPDTVIIYTPTDSGQGVNIKNGSTSIAYFRNDGDVGIGTTSPSGKLHLYERSTEQIIFDPVKKLSADKETQLKLYNGAPSIGFIDTTTDATDYVIYVDNNYLAFGSYVDATSWTTLMAIDPNGNLQMDGDLTVSGNDIKDSSGSAAITFSAGNTQINGDLKVSGADKKIYLSEDNSVYLYRESSTGDFVIRLG